MYLSAAALADAADPSPPTGERAGRGDQQCGSRDPAMKFGLCVVVHSHGVLLRLPRPLVGRVHLLGATSHPNSHTFSAKSFEKGSARHPSRMVARRVGRQARGADPPGRRPFQGIQAAWGAGAGSNTRVARRLARVVTTDTQQPFPPPATQPLSPA
jgi:hypothetical protein